MDSRLELCIRRAVRRKKIRLASGICSAVALGIYATFGCQLGSNACLRKSDCNTGYTCSEGVCLSPFASDAVLGGATDTEAGVPDASVKADASANSRDASPDGANDGGATDAAPDA